jgi:DNA-binding response OmpR family regulator
MKRILVVEHDASIRVFIDTFLTRRGFNTITAPTAAEADALLLDFPSPPHMAILDLLGLPVAGLEYAGTLRMRYAAIRLIFMTSWADKTLEREAERMGVVIYKPFYPQDLLEVVKFQADLT